MRLEGWNRLIVMGDSWKNDSVHKTCHRDLYICHRITSNLLVLAKRSFL